MINDSFKKLLTGLGFLFLLNFSFITPSFAWCTDGEWHCQDGCTSYWGNVTPTPAIVANAAAYCSTHGGGGTAPTTCNVNPPNFCADYAANSGQALCGFANTNTYSSAPSGSSLCAVGSASAVTGSGPWSWTCTNGPNQATCSSATCSLAPVAGVCNNNVVNGCASGTGSAINITSTSTDDLWKCSGTNGGNPSPQCSKAKVVAVNGVCNNLSVNGCTKGSAINISSNATDDLWNCSGANGGSDSPQCSKPKGLCSAAATSGGCVGKGYTQMVAYHSVPVGGPCAPEGATEEFSDNYAAYAGQPGTCFQHSNPTPCGFNVTRIYSAPGCHAPDPIVNGACDTSAVNHCSAGNLNDISDDSSNYLWECESVNGGTTASCSKPKTASPPPTCGATVGTNTTDCDDQLSLFSCPAGERLVINGSPVTYCAQPTGNYDTSSRYNVSQLSCVTDTACTAPTPAVNGVCDNSSLNGCSAGSLNDTADTGTDYKWECLGSGPSHTDATNCSKPKPSGCNPQTVTLHMPGKAKSDVNSVSYTNGWGFVDHDGEQCSADSVIAGVTVQATGTFPNGSLNCNASTTQVVAGNSYTVDVDIIGTANGSGHTLQGTATVSCGPVAPTPAVNGVCDNSSVNGCSAGSAINISNNSTNDLWNCSGSNGGNPSPQCSKARPTGAPAIGYYLSPIQGQSTWNFNQMQGPATPIAAGNQYPRAACNSLGYSVQVFDDFQPPSDPSVSGQIVPGSCFEYMDGTSTSPNTYWDAASTDETRVFRKP